MNKCGLALLYIDLDGFKAVNDTHGHAAGDDVLKQCAARMVAVVPTTTILARLGGDEFIIVAPGLHAAEALTIGEAVAETASRPYDLGFGAVAKIGVSIGVACAVSSTTPDKLLAEADAALYEAKISGKGCCVLAPTAAPRGAEAAESSRWTA